MKKDVIVVGGGPAGIAAALSAARNGVSTLLVERYGYIGGMATAGLVHHLDPLRIIESSGIPWEIYTKLKKRGMVKEFSVDHFEMPYSFWQGGCTFDPEGFKMLVNQLLQEAGVELLLHSWVSGVITEKEKVIGVQVCNKSGKQNLYAKVIIDATGDADLAAQAGAPFELGDKDGECMALTLCFRIGGVDTEKLYSYLDKNPDQIGNHPRLGKYIKDHRQSIILQGFYKLIAEAREKGDLKISLPESGIGMCLQPRKGEFNVNATRVVGINPVNAKDLTYAELKERDNVRQLVNFMQKYLPGFEEAYLLQTAAQVGVRESRRIVGEYVFKLDDIKEKRKFKDAVVRAKWAHSDTHSGKDMKWSFEFFEGPYWIPYRSLLPQKVDNLLVVGRSISATRQAMASIRIMPICASIGEAAGTAAAIAVQTGVTPRYVDTVILQETLRNQNVVL